MLLLSHGSLSHKTVGVYIYIISYSSDTHAKIVYLREGGGGGERNQILEYSLKKI